MTSLHIISLRRGQVWGKGVEEKKENEVWNENEEENDQCAGSDTSISGSHLCSQYSLRGLIQVVDFLLCCKKLEGKGGEKKLVH